MRLGSTSLSRGPVLFSAVVATLAVAGPAAASSLGKITVTPSFQTAGIIVQVDGDDGNETVAVEVKGPGDAAFKPAHPSVRFEPGAFGTSLFELVSDKDYQLKVTLTDPDGVTGGASQTVTLHTRAEPKLPAAVRVRWVGPGGHDAASSGGSKADPYATPGYALQQAKPGDEIHVLAGTYGAVNVSAVHGTEAHPVVLVADDAAVKPVIDGAMAGTALGLDDSAYIVIDGFEVKNGGDDDGGNGVYFRASSHCILRNSFVHDNGHNDVLVSKSAEYSGGVLLGGFHLIEDNDIADTAHGACGDPSNEACVGQTYYGIKMDNNPGAGNVVRRNRVRGHDDNTSPCGDEESARDLRDGDPVLALVGSGPWTNHDLEFYDNTFEDAKDDGMELDGICVNARIWHNTIKNAQNAFSAAPVMPGPYFFVRNVATGNWGPSDSGFKLNTNGQPDIPTRHVYVYQNTFIRSNKGAVLNLWFAEPMDHNVPIHDVVFKNNVFATPTGGECINVFNGGAEQPSFDGNVWYTTDTAKIFSWYNGSTTDHYDTFAAFRAGAHQDAHGAFGQPGIGSDFVPEKGALVIDRAIAIPGINDNFVGKGPDVGAYEFGSTPPNGTGGGGAGGSNTGGGSGAGNSAGSNAGGSGTGGEAGDTNGGCGCVAAGTLDASGAGAGASLVALVLVLARGGERRRRRRASR